MRAKSAIHRKPASVEAELEQQQQKSKILDEDRKNFHRQAEEIKEKNRQEIEKLKAENFHLKNARDEFIASRKQRRPFSAADQSMSFTSQTSLNVKDENFLRRILDKEKHTTKTKKNALFSLQDKLKQVEENKLGFIEESPLMRNIRILQNRLDKVMIKYNEAQSIQKTYEQVVKRLREERVGYDSQLSIIETSLKGKEQDFEELLLLAHDATHAKEAAYAELKRFEQRRITVQEMRVKYMNEKKGELNKDISIGNEQTQKVERKNSPVKLNGTMNSNYQYDDQYQKQELNDYEEAFRKLKQVTGVIDANEIIQKFKTQGLTTSSLEELRESYRLRIEQLRGEKETLRRELEDTRLIKQKSGDNQRRVDEIETETAQVSNQLERTTLKGNKLSSSLINIKAGIQHLKDLTKFYRKEGEDENHNFAEQGMEEDLKGLNEKLRRMYDVVKSDPIYSKKGYKASAHMIQDMLEERDQVLNKEGVSDDDQD